MSEKYISARKLKAHYSWLGKDATLSPKDVDDIIDAQPAAPVEPVVRDACVWCANEECAASGVDYHCKTPCKTCIYNLKDHDYCPKCGRKLHMERSGDA